MVLGKEYQSKKQFPFYQCDCLSPHLASLHNFLGTEPVTSSEDLFFLWCLKPVIIQDEVSLLCSHSLSACAQNACASKKR